MFPPANSPNGTTGELFVMGGRPLQGELLAMGEASYLMLIGSRVAVVPYSSLYRARFTSVGDVTGHSGERPSRKERDRLTHYSRFPYGIPAPAMSALLALSGQSAPDTIRTAP